MTDRPTILQEREKTHGPFTKNALAWKRIMNQLPEGPMVAGPEGVAQQLALNMIALKMARIITGQSMTKDHWDDIAGYAQLGAEACDEH